MLPGTSFAPHSSDNAQSGAPLEYQLDPSGHPIVIEVHSSLVSEAILLLLRQSLHLVFANINTEHHAVSDANHDCPSNPLHFQSDAYDEL